MKKIGIHQPNFLPWLGYWCKLALVDVFVFNDSCDLAHPIGFTQRVAAYQENSKRTWLSVPVLKSGAGTQAILDAKIQTDNVLFKKLLPKLDAHYRHLPNYEEVRTLIFSAISTGIETNSLSLLNESFIRSIAEKVFPKTKLYRSSDLKTKSSGTDQLIDIISETNTAHYISGVGAKKYLDSSSFRKNNILLSWIESAEMVSKIKAVRDRPLDESCVYLLSKLGLENFGTQIRSAPSIIKMG